MTKPEVGRRKSERSCLRRGVTLLEVLVSMFVLAVGLLGLASLLPVASFYASEAQKYDRAATLGQAAYHDMQLRGYLQPKAWLDTTGNYAVNVLSPPGVPSTSYLFSNATTLPFLPPVVIDPLAIGFAAANGQTPPPQFPAFPAPGAGLPGAPTINRLTLDANRAWRPEDVTQPLAAVHIPMAYALAQRLFASNDDLVFQSPANADYRPISTNAPPNGSQLPDYQLIYTQTGTGPAPTFNPTYTLAFTNTNNNVPASLPSNLGTPTPDFTGDYSWLLTVAPDIDDVFQNDVANMDRFRVSVVIFYKRDLNLDQTGLTLDVKKPPPERMVFADLLDASAQANAVPAPFPFGVNFSGGAVRLRTAVAPEWLSVKPNEWLMLSGFMWSGGPVTATVPTGAILPIPFVQWYRIAAVGETTPIAAGGGWYCDVQLAGPDWNNTFYAPPVAPYAYVAPDQPNYPVEYQYATLCTGAVAVFEYQVILDDSLLKD